LNTLAIDDIIQTSPTTSLKPRSHSIPTPIPLTLSVPSPTSSYHSIQPHQLHHHDHTNHHPTHTYAHTHTHDRSNSRPLALPSPLHSSLSLSLRSPSQLHRNTRLESNTSIASTDTNTSTSSSYTNTQSTTSTPTTNDHTNDSTSTQHCTILVAEDSIPLTKMLARILERLNYSYKICNNGLQVVNEYQQNHELYSACLMDIQMPLLSGTEATRCIRDMELRNEWCALPIIAYTSCDSADDRRLAYESGIDDYLIKPSTMLQLFTSLVKNVEKTRIHRQNCICRCRCTNEIEINFHISTPPHEQPHEEMKEEDNEAYSGDKYKSVPLNNNDNDMILSVTLSTPYHNLNHKTSSSAASKSHPINLQLLQNILKGT
jgi:CheY-like chemotaxis protein